MKLTSLFSPRRARGNVLLMVECGRVFSWDGRRVSHVGGSGFTHAMCVHQSQIYEGSIGGVIKLWKQGLAVETISNIGGVLALASHQGILYQAFSPLAGGGPTGIGEVFSGKVIAQRDGPTFSLCSHQGRLLDGGSYGICETQTGAKISDIYCLSMCTYEGILFAGDMDGVWCVEKRDKVASRTNPVWGLCSHEDRLLDAEISGPLRGTIDGKIVISRPELCQALLHGRDGSYTLAHLVSVDRHILPR